MIVDFALPCALSPRSSASGRFLWSLAASPSSLGPFSSRAPSASCVRRCRGQGMQRKLRARARGGGGGRTYHTSRQWPFLRRDLPLSGDAVTRAHAPYPDSASGTALLSRRQLALSRPSVPASPLRMCLEAKSLGLPFWSSCPARSSPSEVECPPSASCRNGAVFPLIEVAPPWPGLGRMSPHPRPR